MRQLRVDCQLSCFGSDFQARFNQPLWSDMLLGLAETSVALEPRAMHTVEYRILAYAASEYDETGVDLLVVVKPGAAVGPCLRAYLLASWKSVVLGADEDTVDYLDEIMYELRQHLVIDCTPATSAFFEAIADMSIGPLRTSLSGSCETKDLEALPFSVFDQTGEITSLTADNFSLLTKLFVGTGSQLHAARI